MTENPDITPYVDLTIYDMDPQDLFDYAKMFLKMYMPEWEPREGNTEVILLEAMALEVAEVVYAINRVPAATTEALLRLYGVDRDSGAAPTLVVQFNMSGTSGYTIPAGVSVRLELEDGLEPIIFTTDVELVIPVGQSHGVVTTTGDTNTSSGQSVPVGTEVEVLDSLVYVDGAETAGPVTGGRDPELDENYFDRAVQRLQRLSDVLVVPRHFTSYALEAPYVKRATTIDNYNPWNDPEGNGPTGNDPGHVTVAVYGNGANITPLQKTELANSMSSLAHSNLAVHVIDPTITQVNVTTQVVKDLGWDTTAVIGNVWTSLTEYLQWDNWKWSPVVRRNELIQVIGNADGVAYVNTITTPGTDLTLSGVANLTTPGTIDVSVVAP